MNKKEAAVQNFDNLIRELDNAIDELSGKQVWDNGHAHVYDDNNTDYVRQSAEEI